jgi:RHH-type proline utilization regulon transcriptional repressor/proline dehydrogenase/delta 1-pyrroline-5-carboxylate dehydrogenase
MIVDSTALPEQVVRDVMRSAFASAGQRCSALRVLYVQEDIADRIVALIQGAMAQLDVGLPYLHKTDVGPVIDETAKTNLLEKEKFGPVLHIIRFKANQLADVVKQINDTGFGLTMGVHSRNETTYRWIEKHARVGNCYINRDQVGAVVGVQPFGGQGLSGTALKADGPHYLIRFTQAVYA